MDVVTKRRSAANSGSYRNKRQRSRLWACRKGVSLSPYWHHCTSRIKANGIFTSKWRFHRGLAECRDSRLLWWIRHCQSHISFLSRILPQQTCQEYRPPRHIHPSRFTASLHTPHRKHIFPLGATTGSCCYSFKWSIFPKESRLLSGPTAQFFSPANQFVLFWFPISSDPFSLDIS